MTKLKLIIASIAAVAGIGLAGVSVSANSYGAYQPTVEEYTYTSDSGITQVTQIFHVTVYNVDQNGNYIANDGSFDFLNHPFLGETQSDYQVKTYTSKSGTVFYNSYKETRVWQR